jgi:hypothetical protein
MRRLHVALAVDDLDATIRDYTGRLGGDPVAVVPGKYALWRTPEVNLSINCDVALTERLRHIGFEDDAAIARTESTDVNGLMWEWFDAKGQDAEIIRVYGPPLDTHDSPIEVERCRECGFEYDLSTSMAAAAAIVEGVDEVTGLLTGSDIDLGERRTPATWSPLEYACHLRDVLLVQRERVLAARRLDRPTCVPMGRDERVEDDGYREQGVIDVARQLTDAAGLFANVLSRLDEDAWERTLIYNYPEPSERSLRWVAVHTEHEVRHHLQDIRRQLA